MTESGIERATRVVPLMRYRDLENAISWLAEAFGFEVHYTAADDDGSLIYAQMTYGNGMVMLGPVRNSDFDDLLSQPDEIGGTETQSCYLVIEDVEQHFERAKQAGAEIALDVQSDETGGRAYSCRDCEGHLWNFGTFDPWHSTATGSTALTPMTPRPKPGPVSVARSAAAVFAGLAIAGVAIGLYSRHQAPQDRLANIEVIEPDGADAQPGRSSRVVPPPAPKNVLVELRQELQRERTARRQAEHDLTRVKRELFEQKSKTDQAVATTRRVKSKLDHADGARKAAMSTVERLRSQHLKELRTANASVEDLQKLIHDERRAKEDALKATEALKYELVLERQLRQKAEKKATAALGAARTAERSAEKLDTESREPAARPPLPKPAAKKALPAKTRSAATDAAKTETPKAVSDGPAPKPKSAANASEELDKKLDQEADKKLSAVEPATAPKKQDGTAPAPKEAEKETKPEPKKRTTYKRRQSAPKKAPSRPSTGIDRGWPHNTW